MAFEGLAEKLQNVFSKLTRKGKLTEADIKASMREVRLALLEADVNYTVAKKFVQNVSEKAVGEQVLNSLTPGQQVIKIVRDELTEILGGTRTGIQISPKPPTVILMAGLQGAGKTTMCGKLALHFKNEGKRPLLVACDVHRPAAKDQLKIVGKSVDVPVFSLDSDDAPFIASSAIAEASNSFNDIVIVDTAGRLHIDAEMMEELKEIKEKIDPDEVLLVVDAMTGQDAVNAAKAFNEEVELTGVILTKIDGDARGGAALSVKDVTGKPIKFVGTGEKMGDLEPFYPDRMATRILGMGDVLSLIERAEKNIDEKKAMETLERMKSQQFNFNDYLENIEQVRGMGSMQDILGMIPGGNKLKNMEIDEKQFTRIEAIIRSMTKQEREEPSIINGSRRKRIAAGSGVSIQEVNKLISQFDQMKKMMKMMTSKKGRKKGFMGLPF
ncbi:MAG: signal recognition particle protein [Clostridia bacterium]|jgi:signal recognition particle subunit SRP54|nr:signal recognition particle protein [Clostridia bacterium]MBQ6003392.1 signal recognition particle protein [Clostridia bacterium]MBR0438929.1 signal recognition particle protein [Clostridia bacterium]MBR4622984.1 signal recognition particle protein [Clostridia bacterium]MBR6822699.1 signal recognition particle protein [Clostridia bacterium]